VYADLLEGKAIIIGGGIAGLLAARVLSSHFKQVIVLEKDVYPEKALPRNGIPQSHHIHILLMKGKQILTELFPDLESVLISKGAHKVDLLADVKYHLATGFAMRLKSGMYTIACTRQLLENSIIGELLIQCQNVKIMDNTRVTSLTKCKNGNRILGVNTLSNNALSDFYGAHLIVDATGRRSETVQWLEKIGFGKPPELKINSWIGYATQKYKMPTDLNLDWKSLIVLTNPPVNPRMAVIYPVEGDNIIMVGLLGIGKTYPPTDKVGFMEFAKQIGVAEVKEIIEKSTPVSSIFGYREIGSRKYLFDMMKKWPDNFISLGDSVCSFNPMYGQGITVAAMCAKILKNHLENNIKTNNPIQKGFGQRFQRKVAKVNSFPWLLGTSEDLRWQSSEGPRPNLLTKMMQKYVNDVMLLGPESEMATRSFFAMLHLLRSPLVLFHPSIILHILYKKLVKNIKK
jgi:flavin-dependent dehydrogenase